MPANASEFSQDFRCPMPERGKNYDLKDDGDQGKQHSQTILIVF
jgi:hypothetical protein